MLTQPTLLSIAGSDPTGGAGIQADLKTMGSIGVYGAAAITCITVQNCYGVQRIQPLSPDLVREQIQAVLEVHNVTHIKIGMTGSTRILECLGECLEQFSGEVIYDPVLAASTGESLFNEDGLGGTRELLLNRATYLTPNIPELQLLSAREIGDAEDALAAAETLLKRSPSLKAVVIKGGHLDEGNQQICDFLVEEDGHVHQCRRKRLANKNLHGTGCTYASALASYLCLGRDPVEAFLAAGEYMEKLIQAGIGRSVTSASENGPLLHHRFSRTP
ncbi:MAG: bifunctional hydroxymethylpyrimidine kinase/phosphomethylpyrimidine kinase [Thermodesulfobacteriota bacterium]